MTDNNHPITPPPELVEQWCHKWTIANGDFGPYLATQAARWGADQELEACINYFLEYDSSWGENSELLTGLRATRRSKPPSLKELALAELELLRGDANAHGLGFDAPAIRRALEQLDD